MMEFMSKYEIFVKFASPLLTTLIAALNITFVYFVFKFNRKMGQSKLSVKTLLLDENSIPEKDYLLLDKTYNLSYLHWINSVKGLPTISYEEMFQTKTKLLTVTLDNQGELASTNIQVNLIFKAYRTRLREDMTRLDKALVVYQLNRKIPMSPILDRKCVFEKKITINVPYIGADENKRFVIVPIREQFRETELVLVNIKANGHTYFKRKFLQRFFRPVVINHYLHPVLERANFSDTDNKDIKKFIGADNPDKELDVPFSTKRGIIDWLLSLFVEWRR